MNENQALQILVNAAIKAQGTGALSLEEASLVLQAINTFKKSEPKVENPTEEVASE